MTTNSAIADMVGIITASFDGSVGLWPAQLALFALLIVAVGILIRRRMPLARSSAALCVLIPVWVICFSALAVNFPADRTSPTAVEDTVVPLRALGAAGVIAVLSAMACVYLAKGQRLAASAIALVGGWFAYWVYLVAAMSMSGVSL